MPAADTVLLPLCLGLTLLGLIITGVAWRRGNKGRVMQGVGLALAPVALYFSGLLRLVWDAVVAVGRWVGGIVLTPAVWVGLGLLALCVVLWLVGGLVARRTPKRKAVKAGKPSAAVAPASVPAQAKGRPNSAPAAPMDDDMAEIEALLKKRGIS